MNLQQQLRPLLKQFSNSVGKGNLIVANSTLVKIIETMAMEIDGMEMAVQAFSAPVISPSVKPIEVTIEKRGRGRPKKARA